VTQLATISTFLLLLGMAALGFGIRWALGIVALQPSRRSWRVLVALMVMSVISYGVVAVGFSIGFDFDLKGMISATLFAGAIFVSIVTRVSLSTVDNLVRVHIESITDPLTRAYNRRFCDQRLGEEISRAHRYKRPLSILLFDLDHFKRINDTHGHLYGDEVLRTVAHVVKGMVRTCDYFCRYGGEEFLVMLTETDLEGAKVVAERMREGIDEHIFPNPSDANKRVPVTLSIGVTSLATGNKEDAATQLIERADQCLYQCKTAGRNTVRALPAGASVDPVQVQVRASRRPAALA
jgi:diguanylate cyclase (GGDEF)-like protein